MSQVSVAIKMGNKNRCTKEVFAIQEGQSVKGMLFEILNYLDEAFSGDFEQALEYFLSFKSELEKKIKIEELVEEFDLTPKQESILGKIAELYGLESDGLIMELGFEK